MFQVDSYGSGVAIKLQFLGYILQGDKKMVERTALRSLISVAALSLMPLLLMACAQSVGMQAERDKTAQQVTGGIGGVTMLIGAQKLPPPPPARARRHSCTKTHDASILL